MTGLQITLQLENTASLEPSTLSASCIPLATKYFVVDTTNFSVKKKANTFSLLFLYISNMKFRTCLTISGVCDGYSILMNLDIL